MNGLRAVFLAALCASATRTFVHAAGSPRGGETQAVTASPSSPNGDHHAAEVGKLLADLLRASGVDDPAARARYEALFAERIAALEASLGESRSPYRRARRMHDALHRGILRHYVPTADGIDAILDRGDFNCVSATLFYGLAARALDLDVHVVETPRHIFLRLDGGKGREVDIESTSPAGFDIRGDLERFRRFVWAYRSAAEGEMRRRPPYERFERFEDPVLPVTLEKAAGFLWHNTAERALARGEAVKAATSFVEEFLAYPDLANRSDGFSTSMSRAFRIEYEGGRFDTAFEIAAMELEVSPTRTTARDRFLAATSKRIDAACEAEDPAAAESLLDRAVQGLGIQSDRSRLEREACTRIAAAAVRAGDWGRARRMALRYAEVEPDRVESGRFVAWVEARESGVLSLDRFDSCFDARPVGSGGSFQAPHSSP